MLGIFELVIAVVNVVAPPGLKLTSDQVSDVGKGSGRYSDPFYPSPWSTPGTVGWEDAYVKAKDFVSQLTLLEKVNLTTGVGYGFCNDLALKYNVSDRLLTFV